MIRLVQRRLGERLDPLGFYVAATAGGTRPDTGLFEANDGRTLVMTAAAVRVTARDGRVTLEALTANGAALVAEVARRAGQPFAPALVLDYPVPTTNDAEERLAAPAPLHALRALLAAAGHPADPFGAMVLGVSSFDQAGFGEAIAPAAADPLGFPDYLFWVPEGLAVIEPTGAARLVCAAFGADERQSNDAARRLEEMLHLSTSLPSGAATNAGQANRPVEAVAADLDDSAYAAIVARAKEAIAAGEVYQIVPSRTFSAPCPDPLAAYARLRTIEPSSYRFYLRGAEFTLLGASPETSVRLYRDADAGGALTVEVKPIAGTRRRGASPDEDDRLEAEMRLDTKELAEHMMLVDLARNDVARVSLPATRRVAKLLTVERYSRVMHLVSSVTGKLRIGLDAFDALAACLNVGTLTGAPKIRAMQLLRELEQTRRGPYGGAVGWVNGGGVMDTAVVIRTALVIDGTAHVRAGAGVVHDSDPMAEAAETRAKASALLGVLRSAA
ncbi:anthranilate synthase component 1 [Sphingomonas sp. KRR8]|uniref:anthranilate synthase component 1 n=1 Tax=Sphingomonas sp. KRR8 TaxID=2942996 RepID=UPI0020209119|nr:anthranilate synthase component 1 [Sphingomonas sp. KRR8]URD59692.1 anthranilate synthase component 1 [Sphingomonas sp. KRR8]